MYPDVSNGRGTSVAWLDGETSGYTEVRRGDDERIKEGREREEAQVCVHMLEGARLCTLIIFSS